MDTLTLFESRLKCIMGEKYYLKLNIQVYKVEEICSDVWDQYIGGYINNAYKVHYYYGRFQQTSYYLIDKSSMIPYLRDHQIEYLIDNKNQV